MPCHAAMLEKPVTAQHLHKTLVKSLGLIDGESDLIREPQETDDYSTLSVLVAEDNAVNQMVIKGLLKKVKIEPILAQNGKEAVYLFEHAERPFDLILMDCEMPEVDGYEATRQIRQLELFDESMSPVVIVALSAHALKEFEEKGREAGMNDYLTKPVDRIELMSLLASIRLGHTIEFGARKVS